MPKKEKTGQTESFSENPKLTLNEQDIKRIEEEILKHLKEREDHSEKIIGGVNRFDQNMRLHHKIIYGVLVFLGVVLVWYGVWDIVGVIPILKNPYVAVVVGVAILVLTGTFYKKIS